MDFISTIITGAFTILLAIIGWFLRDRLTKYDKTTNEILELVKYNKDKTDDWIIDNKEKIDGEIKELQKTTSNLENNYNIKFANVRQDIANLREENAIKFGEMSTQQAEEFGEIKLMIASLKEK